MSGGQVEVIITLITDINLNQPNCCDLIFGEPVSGNNTCEFVKDCVTKPFFFSKSNRRLTYVRKKEILSRHGLFYNRPVNTVRSLPSGKVDSGRQHLSEKRDGDKSAQWTRAVTSY